MREFLKKYLPIICILCLAIALRLTHINFPFGDYDEGVYSTTINSLLHGFPLIQKTYSSQFPLFIYISTVFFRISPTIVSLRLLPISFSLVAIGCSYVMVRKYVGAYAAVFAALYLSVDSIFLMVSRTFQIDMPWVGATTLSFFFLMLFDEKKKIWYLLLSGFAFSAAILMKINVTFIAVLAFYLLYLFHDYGKKAFVYIGYFVVLCIAFGLLVIHPSDIILLYKQSIEIRRSGLGISWNNLITGTRQLLYEHEVWMIGFDFIALGLVIYMLKKGKGMWENRFAVLSLVWLLATCVVFVFYNPLFPHHLVFFILPSTLFGSIAVEQIHKRVPFAGKAIFTILLIGVLWYVSYNRIRDMDLLFPSYSSYDTDLLSTVSYLDTHTASSDYIIADEQIILLMSHRLTTPDTVDTSFVRIQSGALTSSEIIADTKKYHVGTIVYASGRLNQLRAFTHYVEAHYTPVQIGQVSVYVTRK